MLEVAVGVVLLISDRGSVPSGFFGLTPVFHITGFAGSHRERRRGGGPGLGFPAVGSRRPLYPRAAGRGEDPAALYLDLSVADLADHPARGAAGEAPLPGQPAFESSADVCGLDVGRVSVRGGRIDVSCLAVGERRLAAYRKLGRDSISANVAKSLVDASRFLEAERDENTCRKGFTPEEAVGAA